MERSNLLNNIERIVNVGDTFELIVSGYSMLPLLGYRRDKIIIRRIDVAEPIQNRIAMFRSQGKVIVHRVIVDGENVLLRGDGNIYGVEHTTRTEIIGVVERVVRENGKVLSCTSLMWRFREKLWLCQPLFIRRCVLGILRRWLEFRNR